jgi:O-antigen ligase
MASAGFLFATLSSREQPEFASLAGGAVLLGWLAGRCGFVDLVLVFGYLVPLLFRVLTGAYHEPHHLVIWILAMFGTVLSRSPYTTWSLPPCWRAPLVTWALVVAFSWPVVVLRELDFVPALMNSNRGIVNSVISAVPHDVLLWVLSVTLMQGVGLLWLDRLFAEFAASDLRRFEHTIVAPLCLVAVVGSLLAIYQAIFDLTAWSSSFWPPLGRAAGPLIDANASGIVMAFWSPVVLALALRNSTQWKFFTVTGALLLFAAAWASGSRTTFLALVIGLIGAALGTWQSARARRPSAIPGWRPVAVCLLLIIVAGWFVRSADISNPVQRMLQTIPGDPLTVTSARQLFVSLWTRDGYGTAAIRMLMDSPFVGVGIGAFNVLSVDYGRLIGSVFPADNAQNWFRHQLAELGLIGSIGWICWMAMFVTLLLRRREQSQQKPVLTIIRSVFIAIGLVSLVGMPTQNPLVTFTVWTFVVWFVLLLDPAGLRDETLLSRSRKVQFVVWGIALTYVAITAYVAYTQLRVPYRALKVGWHYAHGFSRPVTTSERGPFRLTDRRAVEVFPAERKWLKLTAWVDHPDAQADPVEFRIWRNRHELVLRAVVRDSTQVTHYVEMDEGSRYTMIETWVERTWQPQGGEPRGLSVALWEWLDEPPPNGKQIPSSTVAR